MAKKGKSLLFQTPRFNLIAKEFSKAFLTDKDNNEIQLQAASALKEIIKGHIRDQDIKWKTLSPKYLLQKERLNQEVPGYWNATGELFERINVHFDKKYGYYVGGATGEKHEESGLELNKLISILEFGSYKAGIPARPLFRPSAKEFRKYIQTDLSVDVNEMMRRKWDNLMKKISK